jgi:hypothetical protein
MRIRITEPVFFHGQQRRVGEQMVVPLGPYRTQVIPGGLSRIAQFVEMPDETTVPVEIPAPTPAAQGAASVAAIKVAPKANPLAARIRSLTTRRAKFQDTAAAILTESESAMTEVEATGPAILKRAAAASTDELTAITDLATSLKELDATNGGPLED